MLKTLLIKIRQKPKPVREQYAFWFAAVLVASLFVIWIVTLPSRINSSLDNNSESVFSSLREDIVVDSPDIDGLVEEFNQLSATTSNGFDDIFDQITSSTSTAPEIRNLPPAQPTSTTTEAEVRPVRIATTSSDQATSTGNGE